MPDLRTDLLGCLELRAPTASGATRKTSWSSRTLTIWFHRPFRTDRWLLLRQHSPVLAHGRCFRRGDVLSDDGSLVASYAREALMRFRDAGDQIDA